MSNSLQALSLDESIQSFSDGNQAYETQDFEKAVKLYKGLLKDFPDNPTLHYNLGNAYYREGALGLAIGYYLKAKKAMPRNEDVLANLKHARQRTVDQKEDSSASLSLWARGVIYRFTQLEWVQLLVVGNFMFWGSSLLRLFYQKEIFWWMMGISGLSSFFLLTGALGHWLLLQPTAVVIKESINVHSAPNPQSTVLFQLHEGAEVTVVSSDKWAKVEFEPTKKGWVDQSMLFFVSGN